MLRRAPQQGVRLLLNRAPATPGQPLLLVVRSRLGREEELLVVDLARHGLELAEGRLARRADARFVTVRGIERREPPLEQRGLVLEAASRHQEQGGR